MKKKQLLALSIIILAVLLFFFVKTNDKKKIENHSLENISSQEPDRSGQSMIEQSSEIEVSYSYEKVTLTMEELKKYREEIEKTGFDSTLFSDQEIQTMYSEMDESGQSISEYLKDKTEKTIDESEIEKARKELKDAGIDLDKFHNNEIIDFVKQAKKENKSVVEVLKENKR